MHAKYSNLWRERATKVNFSHQLSHNHIPVQNKNGIMAFLWRGYSFPNSFLYARCFLAAQLIIWAVDTPQNSHAAQEPDMYATAAQPTLSKK